MTCLSGRPVGLASRRRRRLGPELVPEPEAANTAFHGVFQPGGNGHDLAARSRLWVMAAAAVGSALLVRNGR